MKELAAQVVFLSRLGPLLAVAALLLGGAALIASSNRMRRQSLSRRVDMLTRPGSEGASEGHPARKGEYHFKEGTQGLSVPEQRQVARFFAGLKVGPANAILYFTLLRLIALAALAGLTYLLASQASWPLPLLLPAGAAAAAWFIPIMMVRVAMKRHRQAVISGLPDAIDLLAISADAGVSLESGLQRVSRELQHSQSALASELAMTWAQISIFPNRDQALLNLAERIDSPSLRSIVSTLSQSMRFGTPLAQSLRTAAGEMRKDRLVSLEEKANKLPAMMTFPVMLLIMPTIFLIVGGPAAIKIMDMFSKSNMPQ